MPLDPKANPLEAKKHLAAKIVETYHSHDAAQKTQEDWNVRFSKKKIGEADLPTLASMNGDIVSVTGSAYENAFGIKKSRADLRRLIEQGSIQLDGEKIRDPKVMLSLKPGQILRLDKTHAVRIG